MRILLEIIFINPKPGCFECRVWLPVSPQPGFVQTQLSFRGVNIEALTIRIGFRMISGLISQNERVRGLSRA